MYISTYLAKKVSSLFKHLARHRVDASSVCESIASPESIKEEFRYPGIKKKQRKVHTKKWYSRPRRETNIVFFGRLVVNTSILWDFCAVLLGCILNGFRPQHF